MVGFSSGVFTIAVEVVHVHLHLPQILMAELVELEVDEHIAAQQAVVEDEIDEEVVLVEGEALLAGLEEKALAQFEQEVFELVDDGGFQVGFGIARLFVEAEEFEDVGFFEHVLGLDDDLPFVGKSADAFLVSAESETFVKAGGDLAFQFRQRPACLGGFDFVETALVGIFDGEQKDVVGPTEGKQWVAGFPRTLSGKSSIVQTAVCAICSTLRISQTAVWEIRGSRCRHSR